MLPSSSIKNVALNETLPFIVVDAAKISPVFCPRRNTWHDARSLSWGLHRRRTRWNALACSVTFRLFANLIWMVHCSMREPLRKTGLSIRLSAITDLGQASLDKIRLLPFEQSSFHCLAHTSGYDWLVGLTTQNQGQLGNDLKSNRLHTKVTKKSTRPNQSNKP